MEVSPQEFGELKGTVTAMKEKLDANSEKLDDIHAYVNQQKGAASTLMLLASAVSAVVGWVVSWFANK